MRRELRACIATIVVLALGAAAGACGTDESFTIETPSGSADADFRYVIPPGAKEAEERGESLEIIPADLRLEVGDVIEIVNEDTASHVAGPFFIRAGETLRQRFASAGEYIGECSIHPSGQITITVT